MNWVFGEVLVGIILNITVAAYYYGKLSEKVLGLERRIIDLEALAPRKVKGEK